MPASIPPGLKKEHVLQALKDLDGGIDHPFGAPTGYELVHDGKRYAPKAVVGLACRYNLGRVLQPEEFSGGHERENLEQFLAGLPELWRRGEARPTHRESAPQPRDWRTRKDPFEKVWPEILLWLQEDPDATAKTLLDRLDTKYPGQFPEGQLRTLQRRVRDWQKVMARSLVHGCQEGQTPAAAPVVGAKAKA